MGKILRNDIENQSAYPGKQDKRFEENIQKADGAGIPWVVYHYSYAKNKQDGIDKANHSLRLLKGRSPFTVFWRTAQFWVAILQVRHKTFVTPLKGQDYTVVCTPL